MAHSVELARSNRQDRAVLRAKFFVPALLALMAVAARVFAIEDTVISLNSIKGGGWHAEGIKARLEFGLKIGAELSIEHARIAGLPQELRALHISCADLRIDDEAFSCPNAQVRGVFPHLGPQTFTASASYHRRDGALALQAADIKLAQGVTHIDAQLGADTWNIDVDMRRASATELLQLAHTYDPSLHFSGTGSIDAKLRAQGRGAQPDRVSWEVATQRLTVNNAAGTLASESLGLRSSGMAQRGDRDWSFAIQVDSPAGQAYAEPIFVDFAKHGLVANAQGVWHTDHTLELRHFVLNQHEHTKASGSAKLIFGQRTSIVELRTDIEQLQFPGAFATYLQPFLLNSSFKALQTTGSMRGQVVIANDLPISVDLELQDLNADDGTSRLALQGVEGALHWKRYGSSEGETPRSQLRWSGGSLLGLKLGPSALELETWETTLRLAQPARIPIFNGALAIEALRIRKFGTPQMAFMLDAAVEPIHVAQLCRAFGWPEFGGELSGQVTKLRLENGVLTLGATLDANIFDGRVTIGNMRLENPFGAWPRFQADMSINNLDLEQVTQAFSFGRITGRLSGAIEQLQLFNWEPVSFDAQFYTPENDRSRHRISQRAVQNIGSIGGSGAGVAAALQSGFLRFFEDFNYDRLGISCRLENEICRMNGIAPARSGYYLVKGKGLPRIDVIGNAERVDWPRMMAQLKAATESSGPVVQ